MGARVAVKLERRGFYPAGGGRFTAQIEPSSRLERLELGARGKIRATRATAIVAGLPSGIAERELKVLERALSLDRTRCKCVEDRESAGPGNVVNVEVESEHVTELFTAFGEKRVSAEEVAKGLAQEVQDYLDADVPVGEYLADQLLIPLALAGGGSFVSTPLSSHSTTNMDVIGKFLSRKFEVDRGSEKSHRVSVS